MSMIEREGPAVRSPQPGIKCPGCGEFHTEGHYLTCACDHCQPPDDGPPTAEVPMVVMPRELAERCLAVAQAVLHDLSEESSMWRSVAIAKKVCGGVVSDLQDLLARE